MPVAGNDLRPDRLRLRPCRVSRSKEMPISSIRPWITRAASVRRFEKAASAARFASLPGSGTNASPTKPRSAPVSSGLATRS